MLYTYRRLARVSASGSPRRGRSSGDHDTRDRCSQREYVKQTRRPIILFFFSSRRRHTRYIGDWSSDVCSSDLQFQQSEWGRTDEESLRRKLEYCQDTMELLLRAAVRADNQRPCLPGVMDALDRKSVV